MRPGQGSQNRLQRGQSLLLRRRPVHCQRMMGRRKRKRSRLSGAEERYHLDDDDDDDDDVKQKDLRGLRE